MLPSGKLENIVVFSDAYFKKAQGMWKYTNILTGDKIEEKALRIDGVTIKQGPTKLVLIQADPKYQKAIEKKMKSWKRIIHMKRSTISKYIAGIQKDGSQ